MSQIEGHQPPGWYYAHGDPPATQRYWDGTSWVGAPQPVAGSELPESDVTSAMPMPRIGARLIDWLLWAVVLTVAGVVLDGLGIESSVLGVSVRVATVFIVVLYESLMVMYAGGTLGKMTIGLKVTDPEGAAVTSEAAMRRSVPLAIVGLIWIAGGLTVWMEALVWPVILASVVTGFVMLFTGRKRQTPWDRVAGTVVVPK